MRARTTVDVDAISRAIRSIPAVLNRNDESSLEDVTTFLAEIVAGMALTDEERSEAEQHFPALVGYAAPPAPATYPREWETVTKIEGDYTFRLRVPGGWLVRCWTESDTGTTPVFLPDPNHEWVLADDGGDQ
jgi:hypothetical protein